MTFQRVAQHDWDEFYERGWRICSRLRWQHSISEWWAWMEYRG